MVLGKDDDKGSSITATVFRSAMTIVRTPASEVNTGFRRVGWPKFIRWAKTIILMTETGFQGHDRTSYRGF